MLSEIDECTVSILLLAYSMLLRGACYASMHDFARDQCHSLHTDCMQKRLLLAQHKSKQGTCYVTREFRPIRFFCMYTVFLLQRHHPISVRIT